MDVLIAVWNHVSIVNVMAAFLSSFQRNRLETVYLVLCHCRSCSLLVGTAILSLKDASLPGFSTVTLWLRALQVFSLEVGRMAVSLSCVPEAGSASLCSHSTQELLHGGASAHKWGLCLWGTESELQTFTFMIVFPSWCQGLCVSLFLKNFPSCTPRLISEKLMDRYSFTLMHS